MKKFNVKNNMFAVVSEEFKKDIQSAVEFTSRERNSFGRSRYDKSFVATVVTFNPNNQEVEYFAVTGFASISDMPLVNSLITERINSISLNEEYAQNELITTLKAVDFDYYGYTGYASKEELANRSLKLDNQFMSLYIDIVSQINDDSIDDLGLSIRTTNCLKRAGYNTVKQVKALSFDEIARVRNLGRRSVEELEHVLNIKFV